MQVQTDLFPDSLPITFVRNAADDFVPTVLTSAPAELRELPEATETEKIVKAKAILKWLMHNMRTAYSFSAGKDSSCLMGLAMMAAAELSAEGLVIQPFVVMSAETLIENPLVHEVMYKELARLRAWIQKYNLPGTVHVATPHLTAQFAVNVIGGRSLPSTAMTKRDCTTDLKSLPLSRLRKSILGKNNLQKGEFVVSVTGLRFSESTVRAANMSLRKESPDSLVVTNADGNVAIAPIANWSWDDVFNFLGMAGKIVRPVLGNFESILSC